MRDRTINRTEIRLEFPISTTLGTSRTDGVAMDQQGDDSLSTISDITEDFQPPEPAKGHEAALPLRRPVGQLDHGSNGH